MTDKKQDEVTFDQTTQKALAYLSGIPATEEAEIVEVVSNVSPAHQDQFQRLMTTWRQQQEQEIREIGRMLFEVIQGIDLGKKQFRTRLESPAFHTLVRKSFRNWSPADSRDKRMFIRNLLVNAITKTLSPDSALSLFIDWLESYSDQHFQIIRVLHEAEPQGLTRLEIWKKLYEHIPSEDSAEADLYKLLILDLTTGHLIRQLRDKDFRGHFVRRAESRTDDSRPPSALTSAFEDSRQYVLTELGKQFVTYTMDDV